MSIFFFFVTFKTLNPEDSEDLTQPNLCLLFIENDYFVVTFTKKRPRTLEDHISLFFKLLFFCNFQNSKARGRRGIYGLFFILIIIFGYFQTWAKIVHAFKIQMPVWAWKLTLILFFNFFFFLSLILKQKSEDDGTYSHLFLK